MIHSMAPVKSPPLAVDRRQGAMKGVQQTQWKPSAPTQRVVLVVPCFMENPTKMDDNWGYSPF